MNRASEVVQAQLNAYNARNIDDFVACFSEDVCVRELETGEVIAQGIEAFREMYARLFESCTDLHAKLVNRIEHGPVVIDHEHVTGMQNDTTQEAVAIYEVDGERIRQVWFA